MWKRDTTMSKRAHKKCFSKEYWVILLVVKFKSTALGFLLIHFFIKLSVAVWLVVMRCEIKKHYALVRGVSGLENKVSVKNMYKTRDQHLPSLSAPQSGMKKTSANGETW